jgi:hypothetical protein
MTSTLPRLALLCTIFLTISTGARAECYDVFGCSDRDYFQSGDLMGGPNCAFLYMMRNTIYRERGYCFTTPRAIQTFGNAGCRFDNVNEVPLNRFERANVATIQSVEKTMHCSR